ncbi:hypothetical protein CSPX01_05295 [Colletotrichum filicis]|nr:hypothetical protein CSPX01_05295 [Colletotrichum filicis]
MTTAAHLKTLRVRQRGTVCGPRQEYSTIGGGQRRRVVDYPRMAVESLQDPEQLRARTQASMHHLLLDRDELFCASAESRSCPRLRTDHHPSNSPESENLH